MCLKSGWINRAAHTGDTHHYRVAKKSVLSSWQWSGAISFSWLSGGLLAEGDNNPGWRISYKWAPTQVPRWLDLIQRQQKQMDKYSWGVVQVIRYMCFCQDTKTKACSSETHRFATGFWGPAVHAAVRHSIQRRENQGGWLVLWLCCSESWYRGIKPNATAVKLFLCAAKNTRFEQKLDKLSSSMLSPCFCSAAVSDSLCKLLKLQVKKREETEPLLTTWPCIWGVIRQFYTLQEL